MRTRILPGQEGFFAELRPVDQGAARTIEVRASLPVSVKQAVASGVLRPEPLPGAYIVADLPAFELLATYSLIEL